MPRIAAIAVVLVLVGAPAAAAATWSVQATPTPARAAGSTLTGVSCGSDTSCIAVGESFDSAGRTRAVAELWNGTSWTLQSISGLPKSGQSFLSGVSCASATWCTAVGQQIDRRGRQRPLAELWTGTRWSAQPTPDLVPAQPSQELDAVSCTAVKACWAVGAFGRVRYSPSTGYVDTFSGLIERWNGHHWSVQHVIGAPPGTGLHLAAVSCRSASMCVTVGHSSSPDPGSPLAWRWNGHHWVNLHPPNHGEYAELLAVSCGAGPSCLAVGHSFLSREQSTLSERWNGVHWKVQSPPVPSQTGGAVLTGVSCLSISGCIAVGAAGNVDPSGGLADFWNGTQWTVLPTPGGDGWPLHQVSCRPAFCVAVGSHGNATLAERYS